MQIEYRVKPVTRYIITRFDSDGQTSGVSTMGEYDNGNLAYQVAYALCSAEHQRLGLPVGDPQISYPAHLESGETLPNKSNDAF